MKIYGYLEDNDIIKEGDEVINNNFKEIVDSNFQFINKTKKYYDDFFSHETYKCDVIIKRFLFNKEELFEIIHKYPNIFKFNNEFEEMCIDIKSEIIKNMTDDEIKKFAFFFEKFSNLEEYHNIPIWKDVSYILRKERSAILGIEKYGSLEEWIKQCKSKCGNIKNEQ